MNKLLFAHSGHLHTDVVNQAGFNISYTTYMWFILAISVLSIILVSRILLKHRADTTLLIMGLSLTLYGVVTSAHPGPYSAIGLLGGFTSALTLVRVKLSALQQ